MNRQVKFLHLAWFIQDRPQAGVSATVQLEAHRYDENLHPLVSSPTLTWAHMSLELRR